MSEITRLLELVNDGDCDAEERLLGLVHDELKRIAAARLATERPGHTLQTTALVNEAYLRLMGKRFVKSSSEVEKADELAEEPSIRWNSRAHFFSAAAEAMRRILIDNARRRQRKKRGGNNKQVAMAGLDLRINTPDVNLELLDEALTKLESQNPDHAAVVKLRYFAGMTIEQTAEALGTSPATVKRSWAYSRAWLRREIAD